jgi:hypothetical protein
MTLTAQETAQHLYDIELKQTKARYFRFLRWQAVGRLAHLLHRRLALLSRAGRQARGGLGR